MHRSLATTLLLSLGPVLGAHAAVTTDVAKTATPVSVTDRVEQLFAAWDRPDTPGCVLAVVRDGKIIYQRGYGLANLDYGIRNTPDTVYPLASMAKQFIAFAVHLLAQDGKLSLDDDVRKYVPELHDFGKTITLRHLLHHTSGLRDQWNLLVLGGWRMEDVITDQDILDMVWRQKGLEFAPGEEAVYSNTGYTLLGLIVKRVSGKSLREFADERIFRPLGMEHSQFQEDSHSPIANRAASYNRGAGGRYEFAELNHSRMYSTVGDLARWDQNFYDGRVGGKALLAEMQTKGRLNNGKELDTSAFEFPVLAGYPGYGSGLMIGEYRGLKTVEHGGGIAGYRLCMLRFPEQRFSVIVLANAGEFDLVGIPHKVADVYLEGMLAPLRAPAPSQDRREVRAVDRPQPPSPEQLAEYTGEYYSDELRVVYGVTLRDGKVFLRHPRREIALEYVGPDQLRGDFGGRSGTLRFSRNEAKGLTGFALFGGNGRIRGLRFVKAALGQAGSASAEEGQP